MNNRLKDLQEQAKALASDEIAHLERIHNRDFSLDEKWEIFNKKFAELIVRECCDVLTENVEVALDASGSPVYPEGLIYEHFGVEE